MSAVNVVRQRDAVHVISDASVYDLDGYLQFFMPKTYALPHHPAVIATRGPSRSSDIIGAGVAALFQSYDEMVDGIEAALPDLIDQHQNALGAGRRHTRIDLIMAGWSNRANAPQSHMIQNEANDWRPDSDLGEGIKLQSDVAAFQLCELDELIVSPTIPQADIVAAVEHGPHFSGVEAMDPEVHGLMMLELQRAQRCSLAPGRPECHWVGGFAMISTVTQAGVTQRAFHRWNDEIGTQIAPEPINWKQWWNERSQRKMQMIPDGLSRLQRERMEKKARKGTLRAV
jgi:hypothetical protein